MRKLLTSLAEFVGATMLTIGAFEIGRAPGFFVGGACLIVGGALAARE